MRVRQRAWGLVLLCFCCGVVRTSAAGVTLITHGLDGNADGWVQAMAAAIAGYSPRATNATLFRMDFIKVGDRWYVQARKLGGGNPTHTPSGEVVVTLDWRQLADGNSYNTYQIAAAVAPALLASGFSSELEGRAFAELPLHFIGHSRGGSLVCQLASLLGQAGVWVDHVTTLDAHPLNDPSFPFDFLRYNAADAPASTSENVLFADSYYQTSNEIVYGKAAAGAFWRRQTDLTGGYVNLLSGSHGDVHLWYHGTVDWDTPTTDSEASLTTNERFGWWTDIETYGFEAGFFYSALGEGDRFSSVRPNGLNSSSIRAGMNQTWNLGAGQGNNRVVLDLNSGDWPNPIRFGLTTTNVVRRGDTSQLYVYYQWARPASEAAAVDVYLDEDWNPFNGNEKLVETGVAPGTTRYNIRHGSIDIQWTSTNAPPGAHAVMLKLSVAGKSRHLYAQELLRVVPPTSPRLEIVRRPDGTLAVVIHGDARSEIVLDSAHDFENWTPVATNTLTSEAWSVDLPRPEAGESVFLRAVAR